MIKLVLQSSIGKDVIPIQNIHSTINAKEAKVVPMFNLGLNNVRVAA
jgi:hypothetical protein